LPCWRPSTWTLSTPATVSLGLTEIQAPLGVLMLALTILLSVFFIAYVLWMQGSVLLEARRHAQEMQAQRDLADKAEASRFTELRSARSLHARDKEEVMARLDVLEAHLVQRAQESDNSTAAYVGQLEQQVRQIADASILIASSALPQAIEACSA
jgi:cbb3-type cytochrome oxidase subunit 3